MLNRGVFSEIFGCVSTGKEANVYHASGPNGQDLAIKVYKTSILVFKDRDRWVCCDRSMEAHDLAGAGVVAAVAAQLEHILRYHPQDPTPLLG